jgi:hypothetical protein
VPFRGQHYPPETLAMMSGVLDQCVAVVLEDQPGLDPTALEGLRTRFAQIILGAVARGEKDPFALRELVLSDFRGAG